ncbi:hypothetical protein ACK4RP_12620 [Proteus mirabilis]
MVWIASSVNWVAQDEYRDCATWRQGTFITINEDQVCKEASLDLQPV